MHSDASGVHLTIRPFIRSLLAPLGGSIDARRGPDARCGALPQGLYLVDRSVGASVSGSCHARLIMYLRSTAGIGFRPNQSRLGLRPCRADDPERLRSAE